MKNKKILTKEHNKFVKVLKWIGLFLVALLIIGFIYEQISEYIDSKTLKAPGRMVQVGDHKMHIYCTGQTNSGSSTIILEAGGGRNYTDWHRVQPTISKYTRVCSYDRSGLGFSDGTSDQRTNDDVVIELETLLKNANISGPYIMVGHSMGGFYARLFTARNRDQVAGLIQIDPSVEQMAKWESGSIPLIARVESGAFDFLFRIGLARIVFHFNHNIPGAKIDSNIANIEIAFNSTMYKEPKNKYGDGYKTFDNIQEIESASHFGNLPVIVFSADQSQADAIAQAQSMGANVQEVKNWHPDLAKRLSNNSQHIMVKNSSHFIQQDQPQAVINAIKEMLN